MYILEVSIAVVHSNRNCPTLAGQNAELLTLPASTDLPDAMKAAAIRINSGGSKPPTSINRCHECI